MSRSALSRTSFSGLDGFYVTLSETINLIPPWVDGAESSCNVLVGWRQAAGSIWRASEGGYRKSGVWLKNLVENFG